MLVLHNKKINKYHFSNIPSYIFASIDEYHCENCEEEVETFWACEDICETKVDIKQARYDYESDEENNFFGNVRGERKRKQKGKTVIATCTNQGYIVV